MPNNMFKINSEVTIAKDEVVITINKFPSHVRTRSITSKKGAAQIKINGQTLYSGLHYATRNKIVESLRSMVHTELKKHFPKAANLHFLIPLSIEMEWHVPPNWETVKWSNKINGLQWKELEKRYYNGKFDTDNQWIWLKIFTDAISKDAKLVPEDNVPIIPNNGSIKHYPVDNINDRKLVFRLKQLKDPIQLALLFKYYDYPMFNHKL